MNIKFYRNSLTPVTEEGSLSFLKGKGVYLGNGSSADKVAGPMTSTKITTSNKKQYLLSTEQTGSGDLTSVNFTESAYFEYKDGIWHFYAGKLHGGVWNDYAEYRKCKDETFSGCVVCEDKSGKLVKSQKHLSPCSYVVSDTYGFVIGEDEENSVPVAIGGRVLVKVRGTKYDYEIGDVLCAGKDGLAEKMTRHEIKKYPDRILGIVSEIPEEEFYGVNKVPINGRIWIKI